MTHVGIELLTRQLQAFISLQLLLSQLGKSIDLLFSKLHVLPFALSVSFLFGRFTFTIGLVCFVADHVELVLPRFLSSLLDFLSVGNMLLRQFLIIWTPPGCSFLLFILIEYAIPRKLLNNLMLIKYRALNCTSSSFFLERTHTLNESITLIEGICLLF